MKHFMVAAALTLAAYAAPVTPERLEASHLSVPIADAMMAVLKRAGDESISEPA